MIQILPLSGDLTKKLQKHQLDKKFSKQIKLFQQNPEHPGLNLELLEPKKHGIYSFRIDRKYRAIFIYRPDKEAIEILKITLHYK